MATSPLRWTCLLLLAMTSLVHHVISFTIHKRHSRSTDLGDALRMLERQRRRFGDSSGDAREDDDILAASPGFLEGIGGGVGGGRGRGVEFERRPLTIADLEPWFNAPRGSSVPEAETLSAAWLAKTLGLDDGYGGGEEVEGEGLPGEELSVPLYLQQQPQQQQQPVSLPVKVQPTDQELDAIFGEKDDDKKRSDPAGAPAAAPVVASADKKDKEVMTDMKGDVKETFVELPQTRSGQANDDDDDNNNDVMDAVALLEGSSSPSSSTSDASEDDVTLTKEEFRALLKAVEKLQKQARGKAEREMGEAEEVMAVVKGKVEEAREEAQEAEVEAAEEAAAEEERVKAEEKSMTPKPQPVSNEELDSLFEDETKEVITTDHGEIVKTDRTLKDREGRPVGKEETVEEVEETGGDGEPGKPTLNSIEDFWYLKNYLDRDGERKKRNSKRSYIPPSLTQELPLPEVITPPDSSELIAAYVQKINELQTELDQTKMESYLEDVENDILTEALNQATLAQARGRINPEELDSLQDAIRVEEALQRVKANRLRTSDLIEGLVAEEAEEEREKDEEERAREEKRKAADDGLKRGEPWRKRDADDIDGDVIQAEVPVFLTGDSDDDVIEDDDVTGSDDDITGDDDSEEETTSVALGKWFDDNQPKVNLGDLMEAAIEDLEYLEDRANGNLIEDTSDTKVASLFSDNADQCPAVQEFSTNCEFAGDSIDFEARALCNVHEMCYACGESLGVGQTQCDFIYRAASGILCRGDQRCELEAKVFLNTMKLKHRFLPHAMSVCRTRCTAEFLSIV